MRNHGVSPFACEPDPFEQREQGHDDHEPDSLDAIHEALRDGDQETIRAVVQLSRCLYEMARHAHRGDDQGLNRSYHECRSVLDSMGDDDDSGGDHHG
jgi:hypothetical protein